ncbi:MAG: HTH-type transcriptional repressor YtrA [Firmicutes bacterium ADurb.Bin506]|jgi:GntR family transcriptional regulator|nr:MAG: HTH-type transcriptional repressor YtrA [Firmicutes bacterium ADurb.Bin506]
MIIKLDDSVPIYVQIMKGVMWDIATGQLAIGDKLPSVRDLAAGSRVNPNTVQRAYMELERMGIVETQRGQGTFVAADPEVVKEVREQVVDGTVRAFVDEMRRLRYEDADIVALVTRELAGAVSTSSGPDGGRAARSEWPSANYTMDGDGGPNR